MPLVDEVRLERLDKDRLWLEKVNFIKIDVEGYELRVLDGAEDIINKCHPTMVIEVNSKALDRQGTTPGAVLAWLENHGYDYSIMQENCGFTDPLFDILCLPAAKPPETVSSAPAHAPNQTASATPVVPTLTQEVEWHVDVLRQIANDSPQGKSRVHQYLVYAGLRQPNKKRNAKPKTDSTADRERGAASEERQA